jgi:hypothetical protein
VNTTRLKQLIAGIRPSNPKIAAVFDEVEKLLADPAPVPAPAPVAKPAGLCTYTGRMGSAQRRVWLDKVKTLGVNAIREDLTWAGIEGTRGSYNWAASDALLADCDARGIKVLAIADYSPGWANGGRDDKYPPLDGFFLDYATFCGKLAQRYPQLLGIELWNEPWHPGFWKPSAQPGRYAALAKGAAAEIKRVNPAMKVGVSFDLHYTQSAAFAPPWLPWAETIAKADLGWQNIDFLSVHPYPAQQSPYATQGIDGLGRVRELDRIAKAAGRQQPLWATEWGYDTSGVNEANALKWTTECLTRLHKEWLVERSFCFFLDPGQAGQSEYNLVRPDGSLKPAASVFGQV